MNRKFIKVKSITSYHVIPIDEIKFVWPHENKECENKSTIFIKDCEKVLYSTESPEEIYNIINLK